MKNICCCFQIFEIYELPFAATLAPPPSQKDRSRAATVEMQVGRGEELPTKLCRPKLAAIAKKCVHRVYSVYKMNTVCRVNKGEGITGCTRRVLCVYRVYMGLPGCTRAQST